MKKMFLFITIFAFVSCGEKAAKANDNVHWIDPNPALSNEINLNIQNQLLSLNNPCPETIEESSYDLNCALVPIFPGKASIDRESE